MGPSKIKIRGFFICNKCVKPFIVFCMKVANMETKKKKNYNQELYFDVIEEIKKQFGDCIFREKPSLFAEVAALINEDKPKVEAPKKPEKKQVQVKESKPLAVWTGRKPTIQKPESQAIKDRIIEFASKVERFTRAEAKEACHGAISEHYPIDSVIHSQIVYLLKHNLIKTVGRGLKQTLKNGKKKINYYSLA